MGEKSDPGWKVATLACAVLLVGAVVAIVVLAISGGDESDKTALEEQVQGLENQVDGLEEEI